MPETADFLDGFGLYVNLRLNNYIIKHIDISHISIGSKKYSKYEYPITIIMNGTGQLKDIQEMQLLLINKTSIPKIIYTKYGNPYRCTLNDWTFKTPDDGHTIYAIVLGYADRI